MRKLKAVQAEALKISGKNTTLYNFIQLYNQNPLTSKQKGHVNVKVKAITNVM